MKVAVVGSSGYIACYLLDKFTEISEVEEIVKIGRNAECRLDLAQAQTFDYSVLIGIDYVIFTAAISGPDKCADEYEECWNINVVGTEYFIEKALSYGCRVLFFSSDAVYGDIPGHIYSEKSVTRAETPYGRMKKAIEDRFRSNGGFKAIRLSYVVSGKDKFISYCIKCLCNKESAEIFHPFYRNCVMLSEVGEVVVWLMKQWDEFPYMFLNVCGEEFVSRVRMADELARMTNGELVYTIASPKEEFYKNRPKYTQMKSLYLHKIIQHKSFTERFQNELEGYINAKP